MLYKYLHNILNFACWPIKPKIFTSWPFKKVFVDPWYRTVPGTWWVLSEYKLLFTVLFSTLLFYTKLHSHALWINCWSRGERPKSQWNTSYSLICGLIRAPVLSPLKGALTVVQLKEGHSRFTPRFQRQDSCPDSRGKILPPLQINYLFKTWPRVPVTFVAYQETILRSSQLDKAVFKFRS